MVIPREPGLPLGRGGVSAFLGPFVRRYLIENGPSNPTDIHNYYSSRFAIAITAGNNPWRRSTFRSFLIWMRMAARVGLVEKISETEEPRGEAPFLTRRTFYKITALGEQTEGGPWLDVREVLYPVDPERKKAYSARARKRKQENRALLREFLGQEPEPAKPPVARQPSAPIPTPPSEPVARELPRDRLSLTGLLISQLEAISPSIDRALDAVEQLKGAGIDPVNLAIITTSAEDILSAIDSVDRRDRWMAFLGNLRGYARRLRRGDIE